MAGPVIVVMDTSIAPADTVQPPGPVPPVTAPNSSMVSVPGQECHFVNFMPSANVMAMGPVTVGPPFPGVGSGTALATSRQVTVTSPYLLLGTAPARTATDTTVQNLTNAMGGMHIPTQATVITG